MSHYLFYLSLVFLPSAGIAQSDPDCTIFLSRSREFILSTEVSDAAAEPLIAVNADGKWKDIDYGNERAGAWEVADHMRRIRSLAIVWSRANSACYHSELVKRTIFSALDHWIERRYKNKNWWYNEIGIPQIARDILVLMRGDLGPERLQKTMEILGQYRLAGTGANLVWSADLGLHYGALTRNMVLMQQCRDTIVQSIKITAEEGVQPDHSFHQHGSRLQIYQYGGAFLRENVLLAWELRGTQLAFPATAIQVLTDFAVNGWQWMARGINTVPGTIDRAASRHNALHSADIRSLIPYFSQLQPDSARVFMRMLAVQEGKYFPEGYRYFPYSDFSAFQQPAFSFFLKTSSTRTLLTESINEENLKGRLLNSGDGYFVSRGDEYYNLLPCWDWDALPGITNFVSENKDTISRQTLTGDVSDSSGGLAIMDYALYNNEQGVSAKKAWASYKGVVVALIAGMETRNLTGPAFTVLDQCRWQSDVTVDDSEILQEGTYGYAHPRWIHHSCFVYIPITGDSVSVQVADKTGCWYDINRSESSGIVHEKVFTARIIHPAKPSAAAYAVAYARTPKEAARIVKKPGWKVLRNDTICQAVRFGKKIMMAAFYKAGRIELGKFGSMVVDRPCLVMLSDKKMHISDPSHSGGVFSGETGKRHFSILLPADGTSVAVW